MGFTAPSMEHTTAGQTVYCGCQIMSLKAQPHQLALVFPVGAASWAVPCSPDGYLFHQPPLLHPWFTPAQDSLQNSCCKAAPANNFAKWLLSKSWAAQTDWLLRLQQLLAETLPFLAPPLGCTRAFLPEGWSDPSVHTARPGVLGPFKAYICVPQVHPWLQCQNTQNNPRWSQIQTQCITET